MECLAMNYYSVKKKNPNILAENLDEHFSISLYRFLCLKVVNIFLYLCLKVVNKDGNGHKHPNHFKQKNVYIIEDLRTEQRHILWFH